MFEELKGICLVDLLFLAALGFIVGGLAGMFLGFASVDSERTYKAGQQSCAVCEVVKNVK